MYALLKKFVRTALSKFGYQVVQLGKSHLPIETFQNLAQAYELRLAEANPRSAAIPADEVRPRLMARLLGTPPSEAYFIVEALTRTRTLEGDVCEFGVAQGETSALIANEIIKTGKTLHLFDSFEGLPKPTAHDQLKDDIFSLGSMEAYTATMSCPESMVVARLASVKFPSDRSVIHKGFIENILGSDKNLPAAVSFAYVDFDFYEPIALTLAFLHDRLPAGGVIIVDDYDFFSTGAKTAVDNFVQDKNAEVAIYEVLIPDVRYGHFAVLTKKLVAGPSPATA